MIYPRLRSIATLAAAVCAALPAAAQPARPPAAPSCAVSFHVATTSDQQGVRWDTPTPDMQKWWTRNRVPGLCYTSDAEAADYIALWRAETITVSRPYSVDVPMTITGGWLAYVNLHATRPPVSTPMIPEFGTMSDWVSSTHEQRKVTITIYRRDAGDALADLVAREPLFSVTKTGESWSKPDQDALAEAVRKLNASHRPRR